MRFCEFCGFQLRNPDAKFCRNCGAALPERKEAPARQPATIVTPQPLEAQLKPSIGSRINLVLGIVVALQVIVVAVLALRPCS
ncbi:MAG: zinc-ribbon domain-containing protein [Actinobacteria bacterium]|nr:zinc-ribbon domain-containing protein [Actinomycetota bacterium]